MYSGMYVYSGIIFNTLYIEIKHILKKFPSNKINGTENALFFLSRAPTHHSFTFNLRFLYELKHKVRLSKTVFGIFHFRFRFVFIKVYIFVQQNVWTLWLYNVITPFKMKIIEKPHTVLLPHVWFINCSKKFGAPQNWPGDKFLNPKSFWEHLNSNF